MAAGRTAQSALESENAAKILGYGAKHPYVAWAVFNPRNGQFENPAVQLLRPNQQLGIKEPVRVFHQRQEFIRCLPRDRFEPTLRVGKTSLEKAFQENVVVAGQELPFEAARRQLRPE